MKTSYQILWVDDEETYVKEWQIDVEEFLEKYGIKTETILVRTPENGEAELTKQKVEGYLAANPDIDILMVDFNMEGLQGDELIKFIRENQIYLPIIFYSSSPMRELYGAAQELQLDGVYITSRDHFQEKVQNVIASLIKKEQTLQPTRGLLMDGVSEIDARLPQLIVKAWDSANQNVKENIQRYLRDEIVCRRAESGQNLCDEFPDNLEELEAHFRDKLGSTAYDVYSRCRLAAKLLRLLSHDKDEISTLKGFIKDDQSSLGALRNKYAHRTRKKLEEEHSDDLCIHIRKEIRKQIKNLENIESAF